MIRVLVLEWCRGDYADVGSGASRVERYGDHRSLRRCRVNVLVTGSHGLIGCALIPKLRAGDARVLRLVRGEPEGSDDVRWDPVAGTIDATGLEGVDAVVHL